MDVGLLFPFRNPPQWRTPWPQFYAEQLKQTQIAEELGYDTVWLTEHHFAEDGYSPSLLPIASAVATLTSRVRIGTFLLLLPLHNAVRVGEDAATVDIISNGRFDMGFGQGYSPSEFEGYGIPRKQRASLLEEGIEVIRGMWTQDPFSYAGKHYHLKNISLVPKPAQTPHPPLWIGAGQPKRSNAPPGWAVTSWAQMTRLPSRPMILRYAATDVIPKTFTPPNSAGRMLPRRESKPGTMSKSICTIC